MKRCLAGTTVISLFSYGLGSRIHTLETDLVEGGVVTNKSTTPEDQGTPIHNTTDKPLHSTLIGPWPAAADAACSCNAMWCEIARLYFPHWGLPPRSCADVTTFSFFLVSFHFGWELFFFVREFETSISTPHCIATACHVFSRWLRAWESGVQRFVCCTVCWCPPLVPLCPLVPWCRRFPSDDTTFH